MKATKIIIHELKKERSALKHKIKKLARFKKSKVWCKIGATQQTFLSYQYDIMCCYRNILTARIDDLKGENE